MIKKILFPILLLLAACNASTNRTFKKAEDAQDAGREFIRASLDGDYEKASFYLYADSTNLMLLRKWKKDYDGLSNDEKEKYKGADIRVINLTGINDSVSTYTYANSYKNDKTTIRIVRNNGDWQVDLKEILKP